MILRAGYGVYAYTPGPKSGLDLFVSIGELILNRIDRAILAVYLDRDPSMDLCENY